MLAASKCRSQQLVWSCSSQVDGAKFGARFATTDYDGDGNVDLLIGAPGWKDQSGFKWGAIYGVRGPISALSDTVLLATGELLGPINNQVPEFGSAFDVVTHYNSEADILIVVGASGYDSQKGAAVLLQYNNGLLTKYADVGGLPTDNDGRVGFDVASAGDFNGDGYGDFIIGIWNTNIRKAFLYLGASGATPLAPSAEFFANDGVAFGKEVYGIGDIDKNGYDDIAIGDERYDSGRGRVTVFFGSGSVQPQLTPDDNSVVNIEGPGGGHLGDQVSGGFDVSDDENPDLVLVTEPSTDVHTVYIFNDIGSEIGNTISLDSAQRKIQVSGVRTTVAPSRAVVTNGNLIGGPVNDLVLGSNYYVGISPRYDITALQGGTHLGPGNDYELLRASQVQTFIRSSNPALNQNNLFGESLHVADLTGDGHDDVIVGATSGTGRVLIYDMIPTRFVEKGNDVVVGGNPQRPTDGFDYEGEPHSALFFDTGSDSSAANTIFVTVQGTSGNNQAKLYNAGAINFDSGVVEISDWTDLANGFVSNDDVPTSDMRGAAAADIDGDGDWDFVAAAPPGTSVDNGTRLYIQQTSGKFQDDADQVVLEESSTNLKTAVQNAQAVSWADYDRDGQVDLLITRRDSNGDGLPPMLLQNRLQETGDFSDVSSATGIELASDSGVYSEAVAWGDYDNDGDLDLFVGDGTTATPSESRLYTNNLPTSRDFTEGISTVISSSITRVASAIWHDVNNDQYPELLLGQGYTGNGSFVWGNDRGTFDSPQQVPGDCPCLGLVPIDYDYDGSVELITLPNSGSQETVVSRVTPAGVGSFAINSLVGSEQLQKSGPIDYLLAEDLAGADGQRDGDLDFLLGKEMPASGPSPGDLFMQNFCAEPDTVVENIQYLIDKAPKNNWVGVYLVGNGGNNIAGIGARVDCTYDDPVLNQVTQTQWVDGGSMRGSQRSQVLRFGLGEFDDIVTITVTWPDGGTQSQNFTALNEVHVIHDTTIPGLREATQHVSKALGLNLDMEWTFTWQTDYSSKRSLSGVEVATNDPYHCGLPSTSTPLFLTALDPDVDYRMEPILSQNGEIGGYKHALVWSFPCTAGCYVLYRMVAQTDGSPRETSSGWTQTLMKPCVKGF